MACTCATNKGICDSCLQSVYQRNAVAAGPVANNNGEYNLHQIDIFQKRFADNIVEDVENNNPLKTAVKKYPDFYENLGKINDDFFKRDYIQNILPDYPILNKRLDHGPITALEFAAFIKDSNYTPGTAIASSNAKGPRFCDEMNSFYNGDFSDSVLGGFCSLFGNIFGAIDSFFNILDTVAGAIADVFALLTKIKNIKDTAQAIFDQIKVKALIEAIKEKIRSMIEGAIKKVCQQIANFNIEAITGPLANATGPQMKMVENINIKKNALTDACGPENLERILKKVQGLINYAVGLFQNPSIEEIMMLISRICGMAAAIEDLFKKLKDPLNDFADRYKEVFNTLENAGNRVTGEAIRNGGIRPTPETREELINRARTIWRDVPDTPAGTTNGNTGGGTSNYEYDPSSRDPVFIGDITGLPTWDDIKDNTHPLIRIRGGWTTRMRPPSEGWTLMTAELRVKVLRLQKAANELGIFSGPITLNSGYRSPWYNNLLISEMGSPPVARSSLHMSHIAADLTWSGYSKNSQATNDFFQLARDHGFGGVKAYNSFIHCDLGPVRTW